jgi:hypothetical protein
MQAKPFDVKVGTSALTLNHFQQPSLHTAFLATSSDILRSTILEPFKHMFLARHWIL